MPQVMLNIASVDFGKTVQADDGSPRYTGTATFEVPERGLPFPCRFRVADREQATAAAAKNLRSLLSWIDGEACKLLPADAPASAAGTDSSASMQVD